MRPSFASKSAKKVAAIILGKVNPNLLPINTPFNSRTWTGLVREPSDKSQQPCHRSGADCFLLTSHISQRLGPSDSIGGSFCGFNLIFSRTEISRLFLPLRFPAQEDFALLQIHPSSLAKVPIPPLHPAPAHTGHAATLTGDGSQRPLLRTPSLQCLAASPLVPLRRKFNLIQRIKISQVK
ncbi:hypothetical protein BJX62DRAFT_104156 [Aspergillus germanicus]